jgi:hypothetical protein
MLADPWLADRAAVPWEAGWRTAANAPVAKNHTTVTRLTPTKATTTGAMANQVGIVNNWQWLRFISRDVVAV